jgi:predicted nucleic acid-binding protein
MTLVVDASVAAKWVLPEAGSDRAAALRKANDDLIAPALVVAELGNALWKSALRGDVGEAEANEAISLAISHFDRLVPLEDLAARAIEFAIEIRHPVYDCFYLALAERERVPVVSADDRLLEAAKRLRRVKIRKL